MIIFFILIFVIAKAKENTEYVDLLQNLLEIEKEIFLDRIAQRIFSHDRPELRKKYEPGKIVFHKHHHKKRKQFGDTTDVKNTQSEEKLTNETLAIQEALFKRLQDEYEKGLKKKKEEGANKEPKKKEDAKIVIHKLEYNKPKQSGDKIKVENKEVTNEEWDKYKKINEKLQKKENMNSEHLITQSEEKLTNEALAIQQNIFKRLQENYEKLLVKKKEEEREKVVEIEEAIKQALDWYKKLSEQLQTIKNVEYDHLNTQSEEKLTNDALAIQQAILKNLLDNYEKLLEKKKEEERGKIFEDENATNQEWDWYKKIIEQLHKKKKVDSENLNTQIEEKLTLNEALAIQQAILKRLQENYEKLLKKKKEEDREKIVETEEDIKQALDWYKKISEQLQKKKNVDSEHHNTQSEEKLTNEVFAMQQALLKRLQETYEKLLNEKKKEEHGEIVEVEQGINQALDWYKKINEQMQKKVVSEHLNPQSEERLTKEALAIQQAILKHIQDLHEKIEKVREEKKEEDRLNYLELQLKLANEMAEYYPPLPRHPAYYTYVA